MNALGLLQVVNKMDRPALNGFEIIEQLEKEFGLPAYPVNWSGSGCVSDVTDVLWPVDLHSSSSAWHNINNSLRRVAAGSVQAHWLW